MQKVVNISLNGIAYQLEEPGYNELRTYLERAEARLADSPDRAEVMADLEQAIGEKCRATLGQHKTVVSALEISNIIREMGPVEAPDQKTGEGTAGGAAAPHSTASEAGFHPRKRLYRIREGQIWAGVCNGIAAYINVDVTWIRLAVALLTLFSWGGLVLVYILMAFIVPYADTAEDRAAAFGMPFNTEELIKSAKKNFEAFGDKYRWRREWRRQQRHWNRQFRHVNEQIRMAAAHAGPVMGQTARFAGGIFVPIAALIGAAVFVVWILALFSLVTQHSIFGWMLPHGMPLWVGILLLVLLYSAVSTPLRAVRRSGQYATGGYHPAWGALHGLLWLGFAVLIFWAAYTFLPGVRELVDQLMWAANLTATTISETIA